MTNTETAIDRDTQSALKAIAYTASAIMANLHGGCCPTCGYALTYRACINPACVENPSITPTHRANLVRQHEAWVAERAAEEERRAKKARLRAAGFTIF